MSRSYDTSYRDQIRLIRSRRRWIGVVLLTAALLYLPSLLQNRSVFGMELTPEMTLDVTLSDVNTTLAFIVGALGLNLLTGTTGLISVGNAAFFAIGAIIAAAFGVKWLQLPFPLVVLMAGLVGALTGVLVALPSLRIRGLYLMLATMALHFIVVYLYVRFQDANFGPAGVVFEPPTAFGARLDDDTSWYYWLLGCVVVVSLLITNLLRTRVGRALAAVRDNDLAAAASGINVPAMRMLAFAVSSFIVTAAGATYVWYLGAATYDSFTLMMAIEFIAIIIVGGLGSVSGTILGATTWVLFPIALVSLTERAGGVAPGLTATVEDWSGQITQVIFSLLILLVLIWAPGGLAGVWQRVRRSVASWPFSA